MPRKMSRSFRLRVFLILAALTLCFAVAPSLIAQNPEYSSSGRVLLDADQEKTTQVPSAKPNSKKTPPKKKTAADLPTKRYGVDVEVNKIETRLGPLASIEMEQAAPNQIGKGRKVNILSIGQGKLIENGDGTKIRVFAITSPGAAAIRAHFKDINLPEGDQVYVYGSAANSHIAGPYTGKGPFRDGDFWADRVQGETIIIEHYIHGEEKALNIFEISHVFGAARNKIAADDTVLECTNDANCFPTFENNAVGRIVFERNGGSFVCTGTLLTDRNLSLPSLLLTANHCVESEEVARSVEVYWFYKTTSCGSKKIGEYELPPTTLGTMIATSVATDSTLIRLVNEIPDGLIWSGWDAGVRALGTSVFGLNHPGDLWPTSDKSFLRRSVGQITGLSAICNNPTQQSRLTSGYQVNWSSGLTDGGASGSGLWFTEDNQHYLVGVLGCGDPPVCGGVNSDRYGKFSDFFPLIRPYVSGFVCSPTPIAIGQSVTAKLFASDCQARRGATRKYVFNALAGQQIQISLESADFDTYLSLEGPDRALIDEDHGSGGNLNSKIPATGVLTLPSTGTYAIEVSSFMGNSVGHFTLKLNNTQSNQPVDLSLDDSSFETAIGLSGGGTNYAVNRITPPSYPATLTDVAIFFRNIPVEGARAGMPLTIVAGANPSGNSNIDNIVLQRSSSTVLALGQVIFYDIPDITISSGDFVIGFIMTYPAGVFPVAVDQSPPSRRQSYISTNGTNFFIIDDTAAELAGNFGIRARLKPAAPCTYNLFPLSQSFGSTGGNGSINITTASNCSWTATSSSSWIVIRSGASGSGNGTVSFSALPNTGVARSGSINVMGQNFNITQSASGPSITNVSISGKKLFVFGTEFSSGADIVINGVTQKKVSNDDSNPTTILIAKKVGKTIARGQTIVLQVRKSNGTVSQPFTWTRP